jgi:hypothetical protein
MRNYMTDYEVAREENTTQEKWKACQEEHHHHHVDNESGET